VLFLVFVFLGGKARGAGEVTLRPLALGKSNIGGWWCACVAWDFSSTSSRPSLGEGLDLDSRCLRSDVVMWLFSFRRSQRYNWRGCRAAGKTPTMCRMLRLHRLAVSLTSWPEVPSSRNVRIVFGWSSLSSFILFLCSLGCIFVISLSF